MPDVTDRRLVAGLAALATLAAIALFSPSVRFGFLPWDDQRNLAVIPGFRGASSSDLSWILTSRVMGHWVPLTWASLAIDHALWGRDPAGYHATNVVLHGVNAALLYLLARRLLRAADVPPGAALEAGALVAALAFGLHPLRVESVAWVTERRDVLSGGLLLLALLTYVRAAGLHARSAVVWLGLSLLAFAGALLAKQSTIMLPGLLLLLDVYPLRRVSGAWRRVLWEKVPYGVLALAGTAVLATAMARDVGFTSLSGLGLGGRLARFAYALVYYPLQTAVPFGVSPMHEMPAQLGLLSPQVFPSLLIVVALTALALLVRRQAPWLLAAWVAGAVALLPVSGLLHAPGTNLVADRYSYLGTLGWAIAFGGLAGAALGRARRRVAAVAIAGAIVVVLGSWAIVAARELSAWRDAESLWRAAVEKDATCASCRGYLAAELLARGQVPAAVEEAELAARLRPDLPVPLTILGHARQALGDVDGAAAAFAAAAALDPRVEGRARAAIGAALRRRGQLAQAVEHLRAARSLEPSREADQALVRALYELAMEQSRSGLSAAAVRSLEEAVSISPGSEEMQRALRAARASR
jgi:tetratricopeptide (TPR) repeat protein